MQLGKLTRWPFRHLKTRFFLASTLLVSACAGVSNVDKDFTLSNESEKGLLVGSVTYAGKYSGHRVLFKPVDEDRNLWVQTGKGTVLVPYFPDGDIAEPGRKGDVFVTELPPGRYEFFSWAIHSGYATVRPQYSMAIPFEIKAGEALYVGNFHFRQTSWRGWTVTGARLEYGDFLARDLDIMRRKYPRIDPTRIFAGIEKGLLIDRKCCASTDWSPPLIYIPAF